MIDRQLEKNFQNTFVTATTVRSQLITVEALLLERWQARQEAKKQEGGHAEI